VHPSLKHGVIVSDVVRKSAGTSRPGKAGKRAGRPRRADKIEVTVNGVRIDVSPEIEEAVRRAQAGASRPVPREMTTNQAADFLDVSRPFVIKLVRRGELPCRLVGEHRRIPGDAVVAYRDRMFRQARQAADEMTRLAQDAGDDAAPARKAP
jgi:excisionase family DNA binding protein